MPKRTWTADDKRYAAARANWRCEACGEMLPASYECDHKVALEDGGADCIETNCAVLCPGCHAEKTQRERRLRIERARLKMVKLREAQGPARQSDRRPEEVVLDDENPFAQFAYLKDSPRITPRPNIPSPCPSLSNHSVASPCV